MERFGAVGTGRIFENKKLINPEDTILPTLAMTFTNWPDIYKAINRHLDAHVGSFVN